MRKGILVFSGYNPRGVITVLRELQACGIDFWIVAGSIEDPILQSGYQDQVFTIRKDKTLNIEDIIDIINLLRERKCIDDIVILPSTEYLNRVLLKNRRTLINLGVFVPLPEEIVYNLISNKEAFSNLCDKEQLLVPKEFSIERIQDFPIVAKPRCYFSVEGKVHGKPKLLYSREEFEMFLHSNNHEEFIFQEFVYGRSFYLLYHISKKGDTVRFSQENFVQQKNGGSIVAAKVADLHEKPIADDYESLFKKIGFYGIVMVELRGNEKGYYMIEANPRLWGPSQLYVDAGIPIFRNLLSDVGFKTPEIPKKNNAAIKYFWFGGFGKGESITSNVDFHGCDTNQFIHEIKNFLMQDIYFRLDTLTIFYNELKK